MRPRVGTAIRRICLTVLLGTGCGTLGDGVPLPDNWPRTPLRGFVLRDLESPLVIERAGFDLDMPTVEPTGGGLPLHLFGQLTPRNQPDRKQLFSAVLTALDVATEPADLFAPTLPWEGQGIGNPMWLSGLPDLDPVLLYTTSDGAIGVFRRLRDGSLERLPMPLFTAGTLTTGKLGRVSPTLENGRLRLYFSVDDWSVHFADTAASDVAAFVRGDLRPVAFSISPSLITAANFQVSVSRSQQLPAERLGSLFVRRFTTPAGRGRYDLYGRAEAMGKVALVAAASFRGDAGEPFLAVPDPLLAATAGGIPMGPSVTEVSGHSVLLLGLKMVQTGIAVAVPQSDLPKQP